MLILKRNSQHSLFWVPHFFFICPTKDFYSRALLGPTIQISTNWPSCFFFDFLFELFLNHRIYIKTEEEIYGSFCLSLLFSRSQVVMKKSWNDTFFRSKRGIRWKDHYLSEIWQYFYSNKDVFSGNNWRLDGTRVRNKWTTNSVPFSSISHHFSKKFPTCTLKKCALLLGAK